MLTVRKLLRRGKVLCSLCHGTLSVHGSYRRKIKNEEKPEYGWIVQGHCQSCNTYPAIIPEFIMPQKHYSADTVERVIMAHENGVNIEGLDGCPADISTMRRWVSQFSERGTQAVGKLASILLNLREEHISVIELLGKPLLKQLDRLLRACPVPVNGCIIGRTNIVLTTQNCGFL